MEKKVNLDILKHPRLKASGIEKPKINCNNFVRQPAIHEDDIKISVSFTNVL